VSPNAPKPGKIPPDAVRKRHVSRRSPPPSASPRESFGCRASTPRAPECLNVHHIREPSEQAACPETHPGKVPKAPECAASPASANLRKPPSVPRAARKIFTRMNSECDTCPEHRPPGYRPAAPRIIPGRPPRALGECATCPGRFSFPTEFQKNQIKCLKLLKIHRNSSFNQKNPKLIFSVSY